MADCTAVRTCLECYSNTEYESDFIHLYPTGRREASCDGWERGLPAQRLGRPSKACCNVQAFKKLQVLVAFMYM